MHPSYPILYSSCMWAPSDTANPLIDKVDSFFVYLLKSHPSGLTYVGSTVNMHRRLRQHNKEITGGARSTTSKVSKGESWRYVCHVSGFPTWSSALSFEWKWKYLTKTQKSRKGGGVERRMAALDVLLASEKATSKSVPFAEWADGPPKVHWHEIPTPSSGNGCAPA
jgi:predicted GIY-YIG superfamily endonuclease